MQQKIEELKYLVNVLFEVILVIEEDTGNEYLDEDAWAEVSTTLWKL